MEVSSESDDEDFILRKKRKKRGAKKDEESDDDEVELVEKKKPKKKSKAKSVNTKTPKKKAVDTKKEKKEKPPKQEKRENSKKLKEKVTNNQTKTKATKKNVKAEITVKSEASVDVMANIDKKGRKKKDDPIIPIPDPKMIDRYNRHNEIIASEDKWETLEHNGVYFPPDYESHNVPIIYDGQQIHLNAEAEEAATFWAETAHLEHVHKPLFQQNFFQDFKKLLPKNSPIKKFELLDFSLIIEHVNELREIRKNRTKQEKDEIKEANALLREKYGIAIVDGERQEIGQFTVEPPGLFRGRGDHPLAGSIKARIMPEQVELNIGKEAAIPKAPNGHEWCAIHHAPALEWLARYPNSVLSGMKYVRLKASSLWKTTNDIEKFEKARMFGEVIDTLRTEYSVLFESENKKERELAVCIYFIDKFAFRAGGERDLQEEADTVGVSTLKKGHIELTRDLPDRSDEEPDVARWLAESEADFEGAYVKFDFLGKDSVPYRRTHKVHEIVYKILEELVVGREDDALFSVSASEMNKWLTGIMPGLTNKVIRTYNASVTLDRELWKDTPEEHTTNEDLLVAWFKKANKHVAVVCNHQRNISQNYDDVTEKHADKISELDDRREQLIDRIQRRETDGYLSDDEYVWRKMTSKMIESYNNKMDDEIELENLEVIESIDDVNPKTYGLNEIRRLGDTDKIYKFGIVKHMTLNQAKSALEKVEKSMEKRSMNLEMRGTLRNVALTTSLTNYIDPRIVVSWCRRNDVHLRKIYTPILRTKFQWAFETPGDWKFDVNQ
eukprot:TRINITY_DN7038_c1_g1_i1.p1 TRINITY_DN7038_c1_g1~~TRINITY_DN7038_c1_g1_i1.p1  ORF type:complete len:847 (+),score=254.21 TRINITY_DN7038_c1_g1_i1:194-2542(+)